MWLYRHHTCDDIIDLDHSTGRWRPVAESEKPKGARVLADLPVRGSYTVEDDRRYFVYWTDDDRFVFRADDGKAFEICRKLPNGAVVLPKPELRCVIAPARYGDGRLRQGMSEVRLIATSGEVKYELVYNSERYLRLYQSDYTAAASLQDLSDWDFFVALQGAVEIFSERAASGRVPLTLDQHGKATIGEADLSQDDLVFADSGTHCPRTGVWVSVDDVRESRHVREATLMPDLHGRSTRWVWSRSG